MDLIIHKFKLILFLLAKLWINVAYMLKSGNSEHDVIGNVRKHSPSTLYSFVEQAGNVR